MMMRAGGWCGSCAGAAGRRDLAPAACPVPATLLALRFLAYRPSVTGRSTSTSIQMTKPGPANVPRGHPPYKQTNCLWLEQFQIADYLLGRRLSGRSRARSRCPVLLWPRVVRQGSPGRSGSGACPGSGRGIARRLSLVPARFRPGCLPGSGSARCAPSSGVLAVPRDSAGHGRR